MAFSNVFLSPLILNVLTRPGGQKKTTLTEIWATEFLLHPCLTVARVRKESCS